MVLQHPWKYLFKETEKPPQSPFGKGGGC